MQKPVSKINLSTPKIDIHHLRGFAQCDGLVECFVGELYVGKNCNPQLAKVLGGSGEGRTIGYLAALFSQKILVVRSANNIYRPVVVSCG